MTKQDSLTQELALQLLSYDPETGILRRKSNGKVAGGVTSSGYITVLVNGRRYLAHRVIWLMLYGEWPPEQIDHINRIRHDNRAVNLRAVSHAENMGNLAPTARWDIHPACRNGAVHLAPDLRRRICPGISEVLWRLSCFSSIGLRRLSARSGVPLTTLHNIAGKKILNPGVQTCMAFDAYIDDMIDEGVAV